MMQSSMLKLLTKSGIGSVKNLKQIVSRIGVLTAGILLLGGCAAQVVKKEPLFFPAPPNEPRIQFLTSISTSQDVEDPKSSLLSFLGGDSGSNQARSIIRPYGVHYANGKLYVCDTQGTTTIAIIDFKKKSFEYLKENTGPGKLKKPVNFAVDKDGSLYVADTIKKSVLIYNPSGTYVGSIGGSQLDIKPVDVALDDEFIYVLDLKDSDIKLFDRKSREFVRSIGGHEDSTQEALALPTNFTIDDKGILYVTNLGDFTVKLYDRDGHFISKFGKLGDSFGEFARPKGVAVDKEGRIWVVDGAFQNVQVFDANHHLLVFFGDPPRPYGALNLPAGITVTSDGLDYFKKFAEPDFILEEVVFVANQMGDSMISVYGLGHKVAGAKPAAAPKPQLQPKSGGESKPAEVKPAEVKPAEVKPAEVKPDKQ